uniref:Zmp:0000000924 n=1 Tax=Sinocyclocheilus anshuiensis TaxID=1608454 RepID=A0A671L442_9TELE
MTLFYIPNSTQYLNLTTNLLTINTQQISNLLWEMFQTISLQAFTVICVQITFQQQRYLLTFFFFSKPSATISFYYMSNERKSWTESSKDCLKRRANLIIINNREEQDFVKNNTVKREFWIGLTDIDVEGSWKWVDGSNMTSGFWASREPNGGRVENCAVTYLTKWPDLLGWLDVKCNNAYQWICEKTDTILTKHNLA